MSSTCWPRRKPNDQEALIETALPFDAINNCMQPRRRARRVPVPFSANEVGARDNMLIQRRIVRAISAEIAGAARSTMQDYAGELTVDEPDITGRLLGAISDRLQARSIDGVEVKIKTLRTGRGHASEEKRHGADIMGVVDISLDGLEVAKGFLAQAKRAEPGTAFSASDWKRLQKQCETMLERTPDSFVFIYSKRRGVRVVPAVTVVGHSGNDLFALYQRGIRSFFELFIECFVGDRRLDRPDIGTLDALADFEVEQTLYLRLR